MRLEDLNSLYPESGSTREGISKILTRLRDDRVVLDNGMSSRNRRRTARIERLADSEVVLRHENAEPDRQSLLMFTFELDGANFSVGLVPVADSWTEAEVAVEWPASIHMSERRTRVRRKPQSPERLTLRPAPEASREIEATVYDRSRDGLGVRVARREALPVGTRLSIVYDDGEMAGQHAQGEVRSSMADAQPGWRRIGLELNPVQSTSSLPVERRSAIDPGSFSGRGWRKISFGRQAMRLASRRAIARLGLKESATQSAHVVSFSNRMNQPIVGLIDRSDFKPGGVGVVIPPAWGRTKETLLPLARTLVETFRAAGQAITVLRYDGTHRRGESYIAPECRREGDETLQFTYSQAAEDLLSSASFLRTDSEFLVERIVVISFSLASIESRVAISRDAESLVDGWVSVVGMADVQSALRSVSGGIDYVYGKEAGIDFGIHELGGVRIDIDHAASDVLDTRIASLNEARRDMARIDVPVTWIHGRFDGWNELSRARQLLSAGDGRLRKLIEVPTGHQLRNSREAIETFQLIAREASEMLLGAAISPRTPDLIDLDRRATEERRRLKFTHADLRKFWHDYLLGRDGSLGMQLLGGTETYGHFMNLQIELLRLGDGQRVLDLGSGTGEFSSHLNPLGFAPDNLKVVSADLVPDALRRARDRTRGGDIAISSFCATDCECELPFASQSFDRVISSLLLCYVAQPAQLTREIYRVLRPGGVLVLSSPKRDADLSTVYRHTIDELRPEDLASMVGFSSKVRLDEAHRRYLNEGARLVDLEESGHFRFMDAEEITELASKAGFRIASSLMSLGEPPQVCVVCAVKDK